MNTFVAVFKDMLNRRLLRIKVFQALYSYYQDESKDKKVHEGFLLQSTKKVEDEYLFLLNLPVELRFYIENEQNPEEILYVPTKKDIETGRTFVYNSLISVLAGDEAFTKKAKTSSPNWHNYKDVMRIVFNGFKTSSHFTKYLDAPKKDFDEQKKLMVAFYKDYLPKHEEINLLMEEIYIHWNDDKKAVYNALLKTVERITETNRTLVLEELSADFTEDWGFSKDLFRIVAQNDEEYTTLISDKTKKWDTERIADVDFILMKMSLCEMLEFSSIPVKVSINEYLDISKIYSTPKSSTFLNGVLDKIMNELKEEGKILKVGRGLVE